MECRDGLRVIDEYRFVDHVLMYLDPPYTATSDVYGHQVDHEAMLALLADPDNRAKILVSGYEDDPWSELGWRSATRPAGSFFFRDGESHWTGRTEMVWANYQLPQQKTLF